jgi:predicted nucleic acid-binding protein
MMLLDSDALVDFLTGQNDERQSEWFKLHPERPHTTALAVAEVLHAVESMDVQAQVSASAAVRKALAGPFDRRVVPFDLECSGHLARLAMHKHPDGSPYSLATMMTAASALRHRAELVTNRPEDYDGLGIATVSL